MAEKTGSPKTLTAMPVALKMIASKSKSKPVDLAQCSVEAADPGAAADPGTAAEPGAAVDPGAAAEPGAEEPKAGEPGAQRTS